MPGGRRGLVAPQNTFLENIIRRSNSQRKYCKWPILSFYLPIALSLYQFTTLLHISCYESPSHPPSRDTIIHFFFSFHFIFRQMDFVFRNVVILRYPVCIPYAVDAKVHWLALMPNGI